MARYTSPGSGAPFALALFFFEKRQKIRKYMSKIVKIRKYNRNIENKQKYFKKCVDKCISL